MSSVTHVVIYIAQARSRQNEVNKMMAWFRENHHNCVPALIDPRDAGGDRNMEIDLYVGAFNHLNTHKLFQALHDIFRGSVLPVQVMYMGQHDDTFRTWNLF